MIAVPPANIALRIAFEVLGVALCLALGFGVLVLMAEGAGMDATVRPGPIEEQLATVAGSAERIPTGYNPRTGDIFSVADGGHE